MKTTVSKHDFCQAFTDYNREENFTWEGRQALYDYLEELESDTGTEMELDVIAICCDFSEYENLEELQKEYDDIEDMDDLRDHTTVIEFDGGIIIQAF
jgi:hypothetical protein